MAGYEQYTWIQQGYADNDISVSSLTSSGTTATATVSSDPYSVGNVVVISGASPAYYDGAFVITAVTATTFTYTMASSPGSSASGTITADMPALQKAFQYYADTSGGITVDPVATSTLFRNSDQSGPETTTWTYGFASGTLNIASETETDPVVSSGENGSDVAPVTTTYYDSFGNATWIEDPDGYLAYVLYDPATGVPLESIQDVDTSVTGDFSNLPSGWTTPSGGGANLVTSYQIDGFGRTTEETDPNGNETYTVYNDAAHEKRIYPGWTGSATTGPIQIIREYLPASGSGGTVYSETLTSSATPSESGGVPTGTETISASNIQSLSRSLTNDAGQITETDAYFSMSGITYSQSTAQLGSASPNNSASGNYYATLYGYDSQGLQNQVVEPTGTIDRTVYDSLGQRVSREWFGTTDTHSGSDWTPASNTGNMIDVEDDYYDTQSAPTAPSLGTTTGGTIALAMTYYVKVTSVNNGVESAGSLEAMYTVPAYDLLTWTAPSGGSRNPITFTFRPRPGRKRYRIPRRSRLGAPGRR